MSKTSKAYRAAAEKVDRDNLYTPLQAAKLAKETSSTKQDATVEVEKDGNKVCGTSIMGLMMLGAAMGDSITIHVSGLNAHEALEKLAALVEERFGEE